jgi:hypothetical protein
MVDSDLQYAPAPLYRMTEEQLRRLIFALNPTLEDRREQKNRKINITSMGLVININTLVLPVNEARVGFFASAYGNNISISIDPNQPASSGLNVGINTSFTTFFGADNFGWNVTRSWFALAANAGSTIAIMEVTSPGFWSV